MLTYIALPEIGPALECCNMLTYNAVQGNSTWSWVLKNSDF